MSAQIFKASISFVTVAASAGSLFAISWIGLALLGFWASSISSFHGRAPLLVEKEALKGKWTASPLKRAQ